MPLVPNALERLFLLRANQGPGPILDLFGAVGLRAVVAAARAGVFEALAAGPQATDRLAEAAGLDLRATRVLLDLLEALGYVRRRRDEYRLSRMARKWLLNDSAVPFGDFLRWWDEAVFEFWGDHLDDALGHGRPAVSLYEWLDEQPDRWQIAQAGFAAAARLVDPAVVSRLRLPSETGRLLDLGGGHGLFAIGVCRLHPGWQVTVVDNRAALEAANRNIAAACLDGRMTTREGDALAGDIGSGYDAALMFNLIHGFN
jgi:hypothetical protein